jgi:hypothetical protein
MQLLTDEAAFGVGSTSASWKNCNKKNWSLKSVRTLIAGLDIESPFI